VDDERQLDQATRMAPDDPPGRLTHDEMIALLRCREMVRRGDGRAHSVIVLEHDQAAAIARALTAHRPPLVPAGPNPDMDDAWLRDLAGFARLCAAAEAAAAAGHLGREDELIVESEDYALAVARGLVERATAGDITLPDVLPSLDAAGGA
jgi:hypothetical protein